MSNERSTGSNKSGRFGRVGLRQLKLIEYKQQLNCFHPDLFNFLLHMTSSHTITMTSHHNHLYINDTFSSVFYKFQLMKAYAAEKVLIHMTLCYVHCSTSSQFAILAHWIQRTSMHTCHTLAHPLHVVITALVHVCACCNTLYQYTHTLIHWLS